MAATRLANPAPEIIPGDGVPAGHLNLVGAAEHVNVADFELRRLALSTPWNTGPLPYRRISNGGRQTLVVAIKDLDRLSAEWVESHSRGRILIGEVVRRTGKSHSQVRAALSSGALPCMRTRGTARIRPADVEVWIRQHGQEREGS